MNNSTGAPAISVIVPVYNVESYLSECLESLANQSYSDIEIICIDDGSTDESPSILRGYAKMDSRFKVIQQQNLGVSAARNKGLASATGEYVMFVDSDDYIRADTCEKLLLFSQKNDLDIVVFGGKTFPTVQWADDCFAQRNVIYTNDSVRALFDEPGSRPLMCNKMFRRSLFEAYHCRLDSSLKLGEDHAFQFSTFPFAEKIGYLEDKLYFYRTRESSAVNASIEDYFGRIRKHLLVVNSVFASWREKGLFGRYKEDLCVWSTNFLYQDAQYLYPDERDRFSRKYADLISLYCLEETFERIPGYVKEKVLWMLGKEEDKSARGAKGTFDLIVPVDENCSSLRELLNSLMYSPNRGFSIKIVFDGDNHAAGFFSDVPVDGSKVCLCKSVEAALESCSALYVGFASPACRFAEGFLGKLADSINAYAESGPLSSLGIPDLISYADKDGLLGVSELLDHSKPSTRHALLDRYFADPESLQGPWFLSVSPVLWNKLYLREHFVSFYRAKIAEKNSASVVECAFRFQAQCDSVLHLYDFRALEIDQHAFSRAVIPEVELVANGLAFDNWMGVSEKDALQLALAYWTIMLDLSVSSPDFDDVFGRVSRLTKELEAQKPNAIAELKSCCDDEKIEFLLSEANPEAYRRERAISLLRSYQNQSKEDSCLLEAQRRLVVELNERLDALNSSVSFKIGRKITAISRKVLTSLRLR